MSKLTAPDDLETDNFGVSVAVSGSMKVVGSYQDDDNGADSGSIFIFNTAGVFLNKLLAPDGVSGDLL